MTSQHLTAPDGGWGWVIAGCSLVNHVCLWGTIMSLSVFYLSWLDEFGTDKSQTSWVISSCVSVMFISGPICSSVTSKLGYRLGTVLGGILACLGLVISSFATCVPHLIVSIGLLTGFGFGLVYLSSLSIVVIYFDKWRALAVCIGTSGAGVGSFIMAPLMNALTDAYTWRGALLVASGVTLHTCVTGVLMRPLQSNVIRNGEKRDTESLREKLKKDRPIDLDLDGGDGKHEDLYRRNVEGSEKSDLDKHSLVTSLHNESNHDHENENGENETNCLLKDRIVTDEFSENEDSFTLHNDKPTEHSDTFRKNVSCEIISSKSEHKCDSDLQGNSDELSFDTKRVVTSLKSKHDIPLKSDGPKMLSMSSSSSPSPSPSSSSSARNTEQLRSSQNLNESTFQKETRLDKSFDVSSNIKSSSCKTSTFEKQSQSGNYFDLSSKSRSPKWRQSLAEILQSNKDVVLKKAFPFLAASQMLVCLASITPVIFMVDRAKHNAIPKVKAVWLVSIYGVGSLSGRLFFGMLADKYMRNHLRNYIVILTAAGMATMSSSSFGGHFILSGVYAGFFGFALGGVASLSIIVIVDLIGSDKISTTLGLLLCCAGLGHFLGPPIGGWIFDSTDSYVLSYVCQGFFLSLSGLVLLPVYCTRNRKSSAHAGITADNNEHNKA